MLRLLRQPQPPQQQQQPAALVLIAPLGLHLLTQGGLLFTFLPFIPALLLQGKYLGEDFDYSVCVCVCV